MIKVVTTIQRTTVAAEIRTITKVQIININQVMIVVQMIVPITTGPMINAVIILTIVLAIAATITMDAEVDSIIKIDKHIGLLYF